jgi:hypothetical protein
MSVISLFSSFSIFREVPWITKDRLSNLLGKDNSSHTVFTLVSQCVRCYVFHGDILFPLDGQFSTSGRSSHGQEVHDYPSNRWWYSHYFKHYQYISLIVVEVLWLNINILHILLPALPPYRESSFPALCKIHKPFNQREGKLLFTGRLDSLALRHV